MLPVTLGTEPRQATTILTFVVVRVPSTYNAILDRPSLNALQAVISTFHLLMKFLTPNGTGEDQADQMIARQCYSASLKAAPREALSIEVLDTKDEEKVVSVEMEDILMQVPLDSRFSKWVIEISSRLSR